MVWGGHSIPGIDVAVAGRGRIDLLPLMSTKSSCQVKVNEREEVTTMTMITITKMKNHSESICCFCLEPSFVSSSLVTGHFPELSICFSMSLRIHAATYLRSLHQETTSRAKIRNPRRLQMITSSVICQSSYHQGTPSHRHVWFWARRQAPKQLDHWWHRPDRKHSSLLENVGGFEGFHMFVFQAANSFKVKCCWEAIVDIFPLQQHWCTNG